MLSERERGEIVRLWNRKLEQDDANLPLSQRHRNLEPASAEFICALAAGIGARNIVEIGGSSGISTIALAAASRETSGRLISIEKEPVRQAEARSTLAGLGLASNVEFRPGDATAIIPDLRDVQFALIDCEKDDYCRFFDMLHLAPGAVVVADNVLSHHLTDYVAHVRSRPGVESMTLPIGKGLEITRLPQAG